MEYKDEMIEQAAGCAKQLNQKYHRENNTLDMEEIARDYGFKVHYHTKEESVRDKTLIVSKKLIPSMGTNKCIFICNDLSNMQKNYNMARLLAIYFIASTNSEKAKREFMTNGDIIEDNDMLMVNIFVMELLLPSDKILTIDAGTRHSFTYVYDYIQYMADMFNTTYEYMKLRLLNLQLI